jgi:hypothetical protein
MCIGCYEEAGSPKVATSAVLEAAALADRLDPYGRFHIVIDDWNLDDSNIQYCLNNEHDGPAKEQDELRFAALLLGMDEAERHSVIGLVEGFWKPAAGCSLN